MHWAAEVSPDDMIPPTLGAMIVAHPREDGPSVFPGIGRSDPDLGRQDRDRVMSRRVRNVCRLTAKLSCLLLQD